MRGKKTDPNFISFFIQAAIKNGAETPAEIVLCAKKEIAQIDNDIKAIERAKITRSKLLDVISSFEKPVSNKSEEAKILSFFKIQYPLTCKSICDVIREKSTLQLSSLKATAEHNFCIKQMIEAKIIARAADELIRGEKFDEYIKFISGK